jgi:glycosyl hydrolase family 65
VGRDPAGVRADPGPGLPEWDDADFAELLERARSFRRVGSAALPEPNDFLREVVAGLFGVRSDGEGGRFELVPWLPPGWRSMALRRLRCRRTLLNVEVRPRSEWATVRLEVSFGPPIALAVRLRNVGAIARITVDEIALEGEQAIFTLQGQHELMFFFRGEV